MNLMLSVDGVVDGCANSRSRFAGFGPAADAGFLQGKIR
jgi:hypothetical protein